MNVISGTRLGPYEILSPLGAGGMGEVYKAKDTRLERTVAIKVLPERFSSDAEVRQRFEREAKTISSLSHPHICGLYDVGHQDGTDYLVMEYLEGGTLTERLARGPLPTEQVLRYGIQMTDALDKAHRQGIIHRDLKPSNIMLTKSGVKLVDFGLAKLKAAGPVAFSVVTALPTEAANLTAEGTLLGTLQYMAPEQLEGKEADVRADIFAFGAVLYEMATGQKAFSGRSQASLIGAILHTEPPGISTVQPMTPPALDRVVKTCLAKDPDDRWQTAHDVMLQLKWIAEGSSQVGLPAPVAPRRKTRERLAWITAALFGLGLLSALPFAIGYFRHAPAEERVLKLSILPPEKTTFVPGNIAISPDARRLAFVALTSDGKSLLWVRPLDSLDAQPLPGTEEASSPFWSPDSRFIGFFADQKLKKIEASGGPPQTLCDAFNGRGGTWNREGTILFAPTPTSPLYRVSAAGGEATPVTKLDPSRQENSHRWPYFLPDGRHFVYFARSNLPENRAIYAGSLDSKETKRLINANSNAAFAAPGLLLFVREGAALVARSFDTKSLQLTGEPVLVAEKVRPSDPMAAASFSVSDRGVLAYGSGSTANRQLAWLDRAGRQLASVGHGGLFVDFNLSPDQKRVALDLVDPEVGGRQIWVLESSRGVASRFSFGALQDISPVWSPDGGRIAFSSDRGEPPALHQLYQKASSGAGSEELLLKSRGTKTATDWSLDGRFILYETSEPQSSTRRDLWVLPLVGDRNPRPVLQTPFNESQGSFSHDGRWIVYVSDETGRPEVYVQSFPVSTGKWKISADGGDQPRWRRDGKELFYVARDRHLTAVTVTAGSSTFDAGPPQPLFRIPTQGALSLRHQYDVTADGQRFLVSSLVEAQISLPVSVVFNWTAERKQ